MSNVRESQDLKPAIRFKGYTDAWEQRKLKKITSLIKDGTHGTHIEKHGAYLLSAKNIRSGKIIQGKDDRQISIDEFNKIYKGYSLNDGDFLLTIVGTIGRTAIYRQSKDKIAFQRSVAIIRGKKEIINNYFLMFSFQLTTIKAELKRVTSVSAQPGIYLGDLSSIRVRYPVISEQQKIVTLLRDVCCLIAANERKGKVLKKMKTALLQQMFVSGNDSVPKIRFEGYTDAWEQRKLGELGKIQGGGTPDSGIAEYWNGNVNWFTPTEVSNNGYLENSSRKITSLGLKKSSANLMPASTVLITSRAGIGRMGILKYPASTNQGFQSLILNSTTDEYFIYSMQPIISKLANKLASGSTFTEISGKQMAKIEIMIPITGEQNRIGSLMKCIDNLIAANERKSENLKKLKQALMQKMFI